MIDAAWLSRLACPVCLEHKACERCSVAGGGHDVCETSYADRGGKYQGQKGVTLPKA